LAATRGMSSTFDELAARGGEQNRRALEEDLLTAAALQIRRGLLPTRLYVAAVPPSDIPNEQLTADQFLARYDSGQNGP